MSDQALALLAAPDASGRERPTAARRPEAAARSPTTKPSAPANSAKASAHRAVAAQPSRPRFVDHLTEDEAPAVALVAAALPPDQAAAQALLPELLDEVPGISATVLPAVVPSLDELLADVMAGDADSAAILIEHDEAEPALAIIPAEDPESALPAQSAAGSVTTTPTASEELQVPLSPAPRPAWTGAKASAELTEHQDPVPQPTQSPQITAAIAAEQAPAQARGVELPDELASTSSDLDEDRAVDRPVGLPAATSTVTETATRAAAPLPPAATGEADSSREASAVDRAVASQINRALVQQLADGSRVMTLRLTPPELGTVRVQIIEQAGRLMVRLGAEDEGVRAAIERALPAMRQDLRSADAPIAELRLEQQMQGFHQDQRRGEHSGPDQGRRSRQDIRFEVEGLEVREEATPTRRPRAIRLDAAGVDLEA